MYSSGDSNPAMAHGAEPSHPQPMVMSKAAGEPKKVASSKTVFRDSAMKIDQISSQSTFGLVWATQNNCTFDIKDTSVVFPQRILLELTIANTDTVNAATLVNAPFLLSQTALYCNGSDNVANLYCEGDWQGYTSLLDIENATALATLQNWNAPTAANPYTSIGNTIPANGSTKIYLELNTVINQLRIPIHSSVSAPWRVQFYFAPSPYASTSAATDVTKLSLSNAQLFVIGEQLSSRGLQTLQKAMREHSHEYAGYMLYRQILNLGPLITGALINSTLSGLEGYYAGVQTFIRIANAGSGGTPEEQYQENYTTPAGPSRFALTNIALLKGDGSPFFVNNLPDKIMRQALAYLYTDSIFYNLFTVYNWWFTTSPVASLQRGLLNHGYIGTNFTLRANTVATAGANCELVVLGWKYTVVHVSKNRAVTVKFPGASYSSF